MGSFNHDRTDGHRDSSNFNILNGYLKSSYKLDDNFKLKADVSVTQYESQDPGRILTSAGDFIDIKRGRTSLTLENDFKDAEGEVKLYHNFGEHDISDGFHSTDHLSGLMAYQSLHLFPNNLITVGSEYKNYGGLAENSNAGRVFADKTINEVAAYLLVQHRFFNKLSINSGIRMEQHKLYGTEWIPQVGFAYHPYNHTTIKGVVGKGFRSPTMMELYLFNRANSDLKPERMMNYEMSFLQAFPSINLHIELTGFFNRGDNLIQSINFGKFKNSGTFKKYGIESAIKYKFSPNINLQAHYTYLDMEDPILAAPKHQGYAGINYNPGKFRIHLDAEHVSDLYTITEGLKGTGLTSPRKETYTLINGKISYQLEKRTRIFLSAENITNEEYSITYGYPMPESTFFGGIHFNF